MNYSELPQFAVTVEAGPKVLHDGWVAAFYLAPPHARYKTEMRRCIEAYLRFADSPDLRWAVDEDGDNVELSDAQIAETLDTLTAPGIDSAGFHLRDVASGVSGYRIRYVGIEDTHPTFERFPDSTNVLFMSYPSERIAASGVDALVAFHDELVSSLPISSGYVAPAFVSTSGGGEMAAFEKIRALSRRYRCLDIPYMSIERYEIGRRAKGAYWLNYLGPELVEKLGGLEALRADLADPRIRLRSLARGICAVQVDAGPLAGDVNRQEDVSAYRRLAQVLKPVRYEPTMEYPEFEMEDTLEWFARFDAAN